MDRTKNSGITLDLKAVGDDGSISGYASVFNVVDSYRELVLPGAFKASLADARKAKRTIKMLYQHDPSTPIGVWDVVEEDAKGLRVEGRLLIDVSPKAAEVYGLVRAAAIDELSIGYREIETVKMPNGLGLKKLDLKEVSIVTFGALGRNAHIDEIKSILARGEMPTVREFEEFLRDAGGFSKSLAATIASKAAPHLRGDPEAQADDDMLKFIRALSA